MPLKLLRRGSIGRRRGRGKFCKIGPSMNPAWFLNYTSCLQDTPVCLNLPRYIFLRPQLITGGDGTTRTKVS